MFSVLYFQSTSNLFIENKLSLFRLNCGTGPGVVKSSTPVHLHEWNHLSVFRQDWEYGYNLMEENRKKDVLRCFDLKSKLKWFNKGLAQFIIGFNLDSWFA